MSDHRKTYSLSGSWSSNGNSDCWINSGEGVGVSVSSILKDVTVYEVDYCAYSELKRSIVQEDQSCTPGDFEVVDHPGVKYYSSTTTGNGAVDDGI